MDDSDDLHPQKNHVESPAADESGVHNQAREHDDRDGSVPSEVGADAEALLDRAFAGDAEALGPLLDHFRPLLRARESLPPPILARIDESDVVQQTCLLVIRQFEQLRGRSVGEFIAWLLQVHQHNLLNMVDHHRGAAKRAVDREHADDGQAAANIPAQLTSPSQKAVRGERRRQLEDAICPTANVRPSACGFSKRRAWPRSHNGSIARKTLSPACLNAAWLN
jgi:DNA-directed RNA polymerase specialized sigma24 family protein